MNGTKIGMIRCKEEKFMDNKLLINKMKNAAELAWAAYGYYDLMTSDINPLFIKLKNEKENNKTNSDENFTKKEINLVDIMDITHNGYGVYTPSPLPTLQPEKVGKLKGDFSPTQAKRFFEKYDLLDFYPKFDTKNNRQQEGFHACLFAEKRLQIDTKTKEKSYTKKYGYVSHTLAIRGSFDATDYTADAIYLVKDSAIPFDYFHKMILFYESCAKQYPEVTKPKSLNVVGHSLGGCLAQIFALSFSDNTNQDSIINEVYTFNAPGAKNLKPNIILDSKHIYEVDESVIVASNPAHAMFFKITKRDPNANWWENLKGIMSQEQNILTALRIYFAKMPKDELKPHKIFLYRYNVNVGLAHSILYEVYPITATLLTAYQTLTHNHNNKSKEGYKLSISNRIFHIESQNKTDEKHHANESTKENATQHLGKDIEGNYFLLNLNFGGLDSHRITSMTKILYFYTYLYEVNETLINTTSKEVKTEYELHKDEFLKEHNEIDTKEYRECKKALEYCNTIALAVHKILENRKAEKTQYSDIYKFKEPPNWLYAIIEQRLFEAQIKTKETKFPLQEDTSNIIEAILYLQEKGVYIQILEEDVIKSLEAQSLLAYLFAIQETSFFVSVDKERNPLIQDSHTATSLIGYITPRAKIFCSPSYKADERLIRCYANETLALYPRARQGMA